MQCQMCSAVVAVVVVDSVVAVVEVEGSVVAVVEVEPVVVEVVPLPTRIVVGNRTPRERGPTVPFSTGMPTNRCWTWVAFVRREKLEGCSALRRTFMVRHVFGFRRLSSLATAGTRLAGESLALSLPISPACFRQPARALFRRQA